MNTPFAKLVGQDSVKRKLQFYLDAYNKTRTFPFLNFIGAKGLGKTEFVRELGNHICSIEGVRRPFIEINCSILRTGSQFFEAVYINHILDKEVTIFFDEAHALPKDLVMAFLTIFNSEKSNKRYFNYKESVLEFDLEKVNFFFATTESDKIFAPLRDRLTIIDFDNYSTEELKQIFINNLPDVNFDNDALEKLAVTSRGNARNCVLRAKEVNIYCSRYNIQHFTIQHANNICHILDILPLGLNKIEMSILKILRREGRCTLNMLAAKTGLSRTSIQKDHESYLLKMHLISIDGLRSITNNGCRLVDSFK